MIQVDIRSANTKKFVTLPEVEVPIILVNVLAQRSWLNLGRLWRLLYKHRIPQIFKPQLTMR